jgi:hypothetical protein
MSNFFLADRVKETSRVQGIGDISLDGPVSGFSSFGDFYASGDTVFYAITDNVKYEIGSGVYKLNGSTRSITRNPFRSSQINSGPWYVNATSNSGPTNGTTGFFYPLWLSRSSAQAGIGFNDGPYTSVSGVTFTQYPGITFYHVAEHSALGVASLANSGSNYAASGSPVSFEVGVKEVFVTYPGKTAVYNGFGLGSNTREPKQSGVAFWQNEQILNYSPSLIWDDANKFLGINKTPAYSIDVGGLLPNSIIRASGFVDGGSGIMFSGGQLTDTLLTASGGRQFEPFRRNRIGTGANGVLTLSGVVDQIIGFASQPPATFFAGPTSGWCGTPPCTSQVPAFRPIQIQDLPNLSGLYSFGWTIRDSGINSEIIKDGDTVIFSGADGISTQYNPLTNTMLISGVNSYDGWTIFDAAGNNETITNNSNIVFSGINGIQTIYNPSLNVMAISGSNLSNGYSWTIRDSGVNSDVINSGDIIYFSGVNGIKTVYNPSTNVMMVSGDNNWIISDTFGSSEHILNGNTVYFSGVDGARASYSSSTNTVTVSGSYTSGSGVIVTGGSIALSGDGIISSSGFASTAFIQTSGAFVLQNSAFTLNNLYNGKTIVSSGNSQINITVPTGLPRGFGISIIQSGSGIVYPSGSAGVTIRNRQNHTKSAGLWSVISLIEYDQDIYILAGDTGA